MSEGEEEREKKKDEEVALSFSFHPDCDLSLGNFCFDPHSLGTEGISSRLASDKLDCN